MHEANVLLTFTGICCAYFLAFYIYGKTIK